MRPCSTTRPAADTPAPTFQVAVRHGGVHPWVDLAGELNWATCSILRNVLAPFYRPGAVVTLDLSGVALLRPAAERSLLSVQQRLSSLGGQLVLRPTNTHLATELSEHRQRRRPPPTRRTKPAPSPPSPATAVDSPELAVAHRRVRRGHPAETAQVHPTRHAPDNSTDFSRDQAT